MLQFKLDFILGSRVRESADRGQRTEGQKVRRLEGRKVGRQRTDIRCQRTEARRQEFRALIKNLNPEP